MTQYDAFDIALGLAAPRADIYVDIFEHMHDPYLRELNHYQLYRDAGFLFGSYADLIRATLPMMGPQPMELRALYEQQQAASAMRIEIPELIQLLNHMYSAGVQMSHDVATVSAREHLRDNPAFEVLAEADQRLEIAKISNITMRDVMNANLNQAARATQDQMWQQTRHMWSELAQRIQYWGWNNGWQFSLRPFLSFSPDRKTILQSSPMAGIPIPQLYMKAAYKSLYEVVQETELAHTLFNQRLFIPSEVEQPRALMNRIEYAYWDQHPMYAVARHTDGQYLGIGPSQLMPWLLDEITQNVPIMNTHRQFTTYATQGYGWRMLPPGMSAYVDGMAKPTHEVSLVATKTRIDDCQDQASVLLEGLWVLAYGMSLWATQFKLGKGYSRPSWISGPLNLVTLRTYAERLNNLWEVFR